MRLPRFHVPEAAPGAVVRLPAHSAHHARSVLRLRAGDPVRVFDGEGREYEGRLDRVTRDEVRAHVAGAVAAMPESPLHLILVLSPLRGDGMELVIQKATELGVSEIQPVVMDRTDAAARPSLKGSRTDRWEKVVSGAAEQCGRAVVPTLAATLTLDAFLREPFPGQRLLFLPRAEAIPLAGLARPEPPAVQLLVGPPGGFEPAEIEALGAAGFLPVQLGPRVLRSETAALAALVTLQALWGDLRPEPGRP